MVKICLCVFFRLQFVGWEDMVILSLLRLMKGIAMPFLTNDDRWLSVDEIAKYLGVNRETIYRWIERKGLPSHRIGRLWKFSKQEVDQWVRSSSDQGQESH